MSDEDDIDAKMAEFLAQLARVRPVTRNLIEAIMLDTRPNPAAVVDFGLDSQKHYEALYHPIRLGEIMPLALDDALGHGEKLTLMTRDTTSNPHKDVAFYTSWDVVMMRRRPQANPSPVNPCDRYRWGNASFGPSAFQE